MCMYDDGECRAEFYSATERKARKSHKCAECGRVIAPGETYQWVAAKWDGQIDTIKTCAHCVIAQKWLTKECGGFLHHAVIEDLREHIDESGVRHYGFALGRLAVNAQNDWRRKGALVPVPTIPRTTHEIFGATP